MSWLILNTSSNKFYIREENFQSMMGLNHKWGVDLCV